jgi:hypothetical protein
MGSAPGDNTKIIGVEADESAKAPERSNCGLSMNFSPSSYFTNSLMPYTSFSSLSTLRSMSFWKGVSLSSYMGGKGIRCGSSLFNTSFHVTASTISNK